MSMTRNEEFSEAIAKIDMEAWLDREGVRYRVTRGSRGVQLNIQECPCCGGSNWKVYLNQDSGLGNCFSGDCEKKFNKWSFIRNSLGSLSNRDVVEHVKTVAREQGWQPPRIKAIAVNLNTELMLPDSIELPIDGRNLKYLENRSITPAITKYFSLRYSKNGKFKYLDEEGRPRVQDYSKRIILPIFDLAGDLVSFQGRDITNAAEKKYLFPPGFASTGSHLYNGQNARGSEDVVIGEGAFDVMAIKMALDGQAELRGVAAIGSFGKHLSHGDDASQFGKLMQLKERGLKRVTFMWDGEPAALEAAVESALLLKGFGFVTRVAVLPANRDPNEVAPSVVRDAYWKAVSANTATMVKMKLMAKAA
jgi:DNA primase